MIYNRSSTSSPAPYEVLCRICCLVQIQPRKHMLGRSDHTGPTLQHELARLHEIGNRHAMKYLDHEVEIDYLAEVCSV